MCRRQPGIGEQPRLNCSWWDANWYACAQLLDDCVKNATVNGEHRLDLCYSPLANTVTVPSATLTFAPRPWSVYAMSVTLGLMVADVSSAVLQVSFICCILNTVPNNLFYPGISDAYYCAECTRLEKDRDGCPKIVNLGASRTDLFYERRRLGSSFLSGLGAH